MTPIVPSPQEPTRPAFQLYAESDLPILGVGIVFVSARLTRVQKAFCAPLCDPSTINSLDRTTAGYWSPDWGTATDVGLYAIVAGSLSVLVVDEGFLNALNDAVVIAESGIAAVAVSSLLTLATDRPRPFLFGEKAPLAERNGPDAALSYSSSHATVSFAVATSTFWALKRLHPRSPGPFVALGIGGAMAAFDGHPRCRDARLAGENRAGGRRQRTRAPGVGKLLRANSSQPLYISMLTVKRYCR